MSILKAALARETTERNHAQAVRADRRAEQAAIVAAIHKAFRAEAKEVDKLSLKGDYGHAIPIAEAQTKVYFERNLSIYGSGYAREYGLEIQLGGKISKQQLKLTVLERDDKNPCRIELSIQRVHPSKSETLETFHGHTAVSEMLEKFFEVLARNVVEPKVDQDAKAA